MLLFSQLSDIGMNFMLRPNSVLWRRIITRTFVGTNQPVEAESSLADKRSEDDISAHAQHRNIESQVFDCNQHENFGLNPNWKKWWKGSFGAHPGKCRLAPVRMPENFVNSAAAYLQGVWNSLFGEKMALRYICMVVIFQNSIIIIHAQK